MPPPRVLIVIREEWPRAWLRAELRERGYDAVGAPGVEDALVYPVREPGRGAVRLLVLDQAVLDTPRLGRLRARHGGSRILLIAEASNALPAGRWDAIVPAPFAVGDVVRVVEELLPLVRPNDGRVR